MPAISESILEEATLQWFAELGYEVLPADNFDPESPYQERSKLEDVVLEGRLAEAIRRLNPQLEEEAIHEVLRRLLLREQPTLAFENAAFHRLITDGVEIEIAAKRGGGVEGMLARLIDFDDPEANDWMVTSQVSIVDRKLGSGKQRRPDVIVYVNGLPLAVFELKNPGDAQADVNKAIQQLRNYQLDTPSLMVPNAVLVASDDVHARIGSLTADASRYSRWRTIKGDGKAPAQSQPLEVLVRGVFEKTRFLDLLKNFITFEHTGGDSGTRVEKKIAGYHQFHAVRRAVEETVRAAGKGGDKRIGVVWHTQGSGKSLSMLFYARKLILDPRMANPTLVIVTDRNDLDGQLFDTFSMSEALLRQKPIQATSRAHLRDLLRTASGGVYFTTIQKFAPEDAEAKIALSDRRNIVVIADEAHRSQYGFEAKLNRKTGKLTDGLARQLRVALPQASCIGFTGTPVDQKDKNTVDVFGNYISVYDIKQAVADNATVPIYYENRIARIDLSEAERPNIDPEFDELTESQEEDKKEALKSEWSTLEALVGTEKRLGLVAADLVEHFERRLEGMDGKALVVCMSRRIAAELHEQIAKLRPQWVAKEDDAGAMKVVITGSSADEPLIHAHVRSKGAREHLADRFKDPKDPLKLVIVRDMWLTGFDAPCLHTLYVDKPMRGHNLMQAIARVNRVFGDKPGGLVVDYIGIATFLKEALATYSESGGEGKPTQPKAKILDVVFEQLAICQDVFHGFNVAHFLTAPPIERLALLPAAREHVLAQKKGAPPGDSPDQPLDGHDLFMNAVAAMTAAFAASLPHERCEPIRNEVAFYQAVRAGLQKIEGGRRAPGQDLQHAVRQIVANALVTTEIVDIFAAAGIDRPDISILSPEFLAEVEGMKHKNLAAALLARLLQDQVRAREQRNVVQGKRFSEMLEAALRRYRARSITNLEVMEELVALAHTMREGDARGAKLKLSNEESAFFDALAENESAVEALKDDGLAAIARKLGDTVRTTATIDWNQKKSVQAQLRNAVRKILKQHGYPPDFAEEAVKLVLQQAEKLKINLVEGGSEAESITDDPDFESPIDAREELPYPIAVFDGLFKGQADPVQRVKTRRDAFEKALVFMAALALALLRDRNSGDLPEAAKKVVGKFEGKPISMGGWFELACALAAELPAGDDDPLIRSVRALVKPDGSRSELARAIETDIIPVRNEQTHGVQATEEAVTVHEPELKQLWATLEKSVDGLRGARMSSFARLVNHDPAKGTGDYEVYKLHGSPLHFSLREVTVRGKLDKQWAHVMVGDRALSLAPLVACAAADDGGRYDVYMARSLSLKGGKSVDTESISTSGKRKKIPLG